MWVPQRVSRTRSSAGQPNRVVTPRQPGT
jgi:hypothetical protein